MLDGVLWVDEASFVPRTAWDAAQLTLSAVPNPVAIVTTTARGRRDSWVFDLAQEATEDPGIEFFRFRTTDSPYHNPRFVAKVRARLGVVKAEEELDAIFLGDTEAPFRPEDIAILFEHGEKLPKRGRQFSLGIDLAKKRDYTVCTLMNEFGEAWVLGRWRHVAWPDTERRITEFATAHDALVVLDTGHGGGYGGALFDYLERNLGKGRLLPVRTGNRGVKAQIIEQLSSDVEAGRLKADPRHKGKELRHELTFFPSPIRKLVGGVELLVYAGPGDDDDLFDDCVISFALANWGRIYGWDTPHVSSLKAFRRSNAPSNRGGKARAGYVF